MQRRYRTIVALLAALLLAAAASTMGSYPVYLLSLAMINVIAAIGLNLLTGNSGQISLCHSSFIAIGAYGSTLLPARYGVPFWAAIPLGALLAALMGALGSVVGNNDMGFDPPRLVPWSAAMAMGSLMLCGIVAGLYPARQAAMLQPVEALRKE